MSLPDNERILDGKYRLVSELGEGGMGSVWLAHNLALDTRVAVKLIRAEIKSAATEDRLLKEARAAAKIRHPGIVRIFDFGRTEEGDPYLVMELLEGETLADSLDRQARAPATRAAQLLLPIADALAVAHDEGIVHRDLKPENIFLARTARGLEPKILDFGIAKHPGESIVSSLGRPGSILGSPDYMSPEQARGSRFVDHRTDVWSFAVVLYEMIAGERPFHGEGINDVLAAIVHGEPRPLTDFGVGDGALWEIIATGLRPSFEERWPSMRDFGQALATWLWEQGVKEDATKTSLEAVWLTTSGTPAHDDVFSEPQSARLPEVSDSDIIVEELAPKSGLRVADAANDGTPNSTEITQDIEKRPGPRFAVFAVVLVALLAAGGLAVFWIQQTGAKPGSVSRPSEVLAVPAQEQVQPVARPQVAGQPAQPAAQPRTVEQPARPSNEVTAVGNTEMRSSRTAGSAKPSRAGVQSAKSTPSTTEHAVRPVRVRPKAAETAEEELKTPW